jgi:hypothetical protein
MSGPFASPEDQLPPRPRRRLVTRWSATAGIVILLALGFIGGVLVQRGKQPAAAGAGAGGGAGPQAAAGGGPGFGAGRGPGAAGAADGPAPVAGKVSSVDGGTLYVTTSEGTTVKVRTNDSAKVTRTAKSRVGAVHPGDSVVITGSTASNGTVTAGQITATASGVTPGGFGGFGGGGGRFGGQQPGGGASGG